MNKCITAILAGLFTVSLSASVLAADDAAKADAKATKAECDKLKGAEERVCNKDAKAKRDKAEADAKAVHEKAKADVKAMK